MSTTAARSTVEKKDNVASALSRALDAGGGLLRLAPAWVPRSFLHPGKRIKLAPTDWYAYGAHRGGIDERWFSSTTEAANENRNPGRRLELRRLRQKAIPAVGCRGRGRPADDRQEDVGPVQALAGLFEVLRQHGPDPPPHASEPEDAALTGQQGKPESYYFPPQYNNVDNNFAYTFMGLEPGTTKAQFASAWRTGRKGDNGILDLSRAYRLKRGTGWLIPPGVLHAPGSLCTYEPQWGSDVFGMFQSLVEGREVPWSLLVKDVPKEKSKDLDFIIEQLDWEKNIDTHFKEHNYLEPIVDPASSGSGYTDRWIVYGKIDGEQLFSAKELTLEPGAKCTLKDPGASGWITVQGSGRMGKLKLQTPAMIHFGAETEDEVFISYEAATAGIEIENTGDEPLVGLRYFGPARSRQAAERRRV